jgi:cell division septation protein DedD
MVRDAAAPDEPRELRIEGGMLGVLGGLMLAILFGAFQLGRMVERWSAPAHASSPSDAQGNVEQEAVDATEKLTFFDTLSGPGKEAEPAREAAAKAPVVVPRILEAPPGPFFVQVFVGRDRQAAEDVVRTLRTKGYPVRIDAVAEGASGSLFKVRVGGFATKDAADAGAERLRKDGHASTWVVRVGG